MKHIDRNYSGENDNIQQTARRRAAAKLSFLFHLAVYGIVNALLITINLTTSPEYYWFKWPLMGWGIGILFHAAATFLFFGGSRLKEWMVQRELANLQRKKGL